VNSRPVTRSADEPGPKTLETVESPGLLAWALRRQSDSTDPRFSAGGHYDDGDGLSIRGVRKGRFTDLKEGCLINASLTWSHDEDGGDRPSIRPNHTRSCRHGERPGPAGKKALVNGA
jgi:hypothetical protein